MSDWFTDKTQNFKSRLARAGAIKAWQKETQDFIGIPRFVDRELDPSLVISLPNSWKGGKPESFGIGDLSIKWDDHLASAAVYRKHSLVASIVMGRFVFVKPQERSQGIASQLLALWAERFPQKSFGMLRTREGHRAIVRAHRIVLERAIARGEEISDWALSEHPDLYAKIVLEPKVFATIKGSEKNTGLARTI